MASPGLRVGHPPSASTLALLGVDEREARAVVRDVLLAGELRERSAIPPGEDVSPSTSRSTSVSASSSA